MKVCTTAFSFGGGQQITRRHLPLWKRFSSEVMVVSPVDSPCILPDAKLLVHEVSNKFGMPCLRRQLRGMKEALSFAADLYVFTEYDGFMIKSPEWRSGLQANAFPDNSGNYASACFFHFPWIFDRETLERFVACATFEPFEKGFVDRWLAAQVDLMNVPVHDLQASGEGFSRNTIEAQDEERLLQAVRAGAYAIHGVKSASLLKRVLDVARLDGIELPPDMPVRKQVFGRRFRERTARRS